jgi:hypothetical protein
MAIQQPPLMRQPQLLRQRLRQAEEPPLHQLQPRRLTLLELLQPL